MESINYVDAVRTQGMSQLGSKFITAGKSNLFDGNGSEITDDKFNDGTSINCIKDYILKIC